ncbi:MAG: orotidine-5'-phosphate decarboxylase [Puniceicoccales bacterium]|jgi:orotidine-5'-phosphate decarboxylase|nr:orotidine-5'-phosphate decarboxylase [Puniceicoccales bacterium]
MTELILALDVPEKDEALALVRPLTGSVRWVKLGLQLFTRHGPEIVNAFADLGFKVFLDLKLHDIPNTVGSAVKSLRGRPCSLLTVHTLGGPEMLKRAVGEARDALPAATVLGVTVLTSMDAAQLAAIGVPLAPADEVRLLAAMGAGAGLRGFVCSPLELPLLRRELGALPAFAAAAPLLVTPGIRAADAPADDQNRTLTPAQAAAAGATHIVVGRPVLKAADPAAAALAIQDELRAAGGADAGDAAG